MCGEGGGGWGTGEAGGGRATRGIDADFICIIRSKFNEIYMLIVYRMDLNLANKLSKSTMIISAIHLIRLHRLTNAYK